MKKYEKPIMTLTEAESAMWMAASLPVDPDTTTDTPYADEFLDWGMDDEDDKSKLW